MWELGCLGRSERPLQIAVLSRCSCVLRRRNSSGADSALDSPSNEPLLVCFEPETSENAAAFGGGDTVEPEGGVLEFVGGEQRDCAC